MCNPFALTFLWLFGCGCIGAVSSIATAGQSGARNEGSLVQSAVWAAGEDGYHTYRIPSLLVTAKGTVLAFADGRRTGTSDTGDIDLVMKRSTDGGKSWSKQQVVWDEGTNTCGNPCAVYERFTDTVFLLMTHNLGKDKEADITANKSQGTRSVWITSSTDDGETWTPPRDITADVKNPAWGWYATGPGTGIQITRGEHRSRLVVPCDQKNTGQFSHVIYSDDRGKTWKLGGKTAEGCNESQIVELAEGRLMLSIRPAKAATPAPDKGGKSNPTAKHRKFAVSDDGGETWDPVQEDPALIDPVCQASMMRYRWPAGFQSGEILFSNPASSARERMTVRLSPDEGETWPYARLLWKGPSAYSCLARLADGTVLCLHEAGDKKPYEKILLSRFTMDWLKAEQKD
jgi:sialidase-1